MEFEDKNNEPTQLGELGEFGLIKHLTQNVKLQQPSTVYGVGDDAAIIEPTADHQSLVSTDMLVEGVHFDLLYTPLKHLGYKAVVVNLSDIYAMNGLPKQITISLAVSNRMSVEALEEFYEGVLLACDFYAVDLVGGDTTSSNAGLVISVTAIGEVAKGKAVRRDGAKENDLICVSGDLGGAYMGLQLLEREKRIFEENSEIQPDLGGKDYILERQLKPEARHDIITKLAALDIHPTAMMDISDGLSSEILHICESSEVGCALYEEKLPIDPMTVTTAEDFNLDPTVCAMNGGEDYELLFTVPIEDHEKIRAMEGIAVIGHVTDTNSGRVLVTKGGIAQPIMAQGWNPILNKKDDE